MRAALYAIVASIALAPIIPHAFAQSCLDLGTCPIGDNALEFMTYPFELMIGDWIYIIVWGAVLAIVYVKSQNAMLTGLVGVLVFVAFIGTSTYTGSSTGQVFYWGMIILAVAIGGVAFYLLWTKSRNP